MLNVYSDKPRNLKSGQPGSAPASPRPAGAWISDTGNTTFIAILVGLLMWRIVIPGFFDYSGEFDDRQNQGGIVDLISNQLVWLTLLFSPLILMRSRLKLSLRLFGSLNRLFVVFMLYVGASALWSLDPGATFRRYLHLIILVLVSAGACLVAWHPKRFQNLARPVLTSLLIGSLLFGLINPDHAMMDPNPMLDEHGRHLRGLTEHKNALGALASFGVLLWFHGWICKEVKFLPAMAGLLVSGLCLVLAGSSTSMLGTGFVCIFLLIAQFASRGFQRFMPLLVGALVTIILLYGMAVLKIVPGLDVLIEPITAVTGKEATFTGRTPIWEIVKAHIALSPAIGTGYGGYWTGDVPGSASAIVKERLYFYPGEAHNGYLDVINDLGYVGLGLMILFFVNYLVQSLRLMKINPTQAALYLGLLFYELVQNLAESTWLNVAIPWMLLTFATVDTARELVNHQLQHEFGNGGARARRSGRQPRRRRGPRVGPATSPNPERSI